MRALAVSAAVWLMLSGNALAQAVVANTQVPNTQLPTGGQVNAGQASISQSGSTMTVNQTSQRAVVDWNSFNVGKDAQVNFQQPNAQSSTLNRVNEAQPSHIFGRITAPGQVVLVNPQGVYFGKTSSVDVGGLVATTHTAVADEYMKGLLKFNRQGATGAVVNEGELRAALGGYIALLAPEVRNQGVIVANLGTVALAAGEAYELKFDGQGALSNVRVTPAAINTLVENKHAIQAPGGLVILSAQAASRLQSAVVSNSGRIEATGLVSRAGRIILEATSKVFNLGEIRADSGVDGSPAGSVSLKAAVVENAGTVSAASVNTVLSALGGAAGGAAGGAGAGSGAASGTTSGAASGAGAAATSGAGGLGGSAVAQSGGRISVVADQFIQTASGVMDVSAVGQWGGTISLEGADTLYIYGSLLAYSQLAPGLSSQNVLAHAVGGVISLQATRRIDFDGAVLDASGPDGAGRVHVNATGGATGDATSATSGASAGASSNAPADSGNNQKALRGVVAMGNQTVVRVNSQRAVAGRVEVEADEIRLNATRIEAMGATQGGTVLIGGDWQGSGTLRQATVVTMSQDSVIDASATENGNGGKVVLWTDVH
ncbi:MAG: filamentous hemagglutinin N-terminal domain-containing protein, partial [Limnohabitans sp.]